jgi:hypothetical protein
MAILKNTTITGTSALQLPSGTTANRPGSPSTGDTRYNSEKQIVEQYNGNRWITFPDIVRDNLQLHWDPLDSYSGSGTTVTDLSGNGRNGTLNSVTVSTTGGGYFEFNSQSDTLDPATAYNNPGFAKTICFWVNTNRPLSAQDNWQIGWLDGPNNGGAGGDYFGMMFGVGPTEDMGFWGRGGPFDLAIGSNTTQWVGQQGWTFVCCTGANTNGAVRVYRNDQQQLLSRNSDNALSYTYRMASVAANTFRINSRGLWNSGMSFVWLGPVMVYHRELTHTEIVQNFYATKDRYGVS